jgi:N-acetylglucosamine malate deacetylase 1
MKSNFTKILAFGAHPDDIELGCAGTLEYFHSKGAELDLVVMTSGEAGSQKISAQKLKQTREKEARASAKILKASSISFLGFPDLHSERKREQLIALIKIIREKKPDLILTHSPQDRSADHRFYTQLVLDATFTSAGPWVQEVDLPAHAVKAVWGYEVWSPISEPQIYVPIKKKKKIEALKCHESQMSSLGYIEAILGLNRYRGELGAGGGMAEAFQIIRNELN